MNHESENWRIYSVNDLCECGLGLLPNMLQKWKGSEWRYIDKILELQPVCIKQTNDWSTHQEAKSISQNFFLPPRVLPCPVFHWWLSIWEYVKRCLPLSLTPILLRHGCSPFLSTQLHASPVGSPRALWCAISPLENPPGSSYFPLRVPQMRLAYLDILLLPGTLPSSLVYHICF